MMWRTVINAIARGLYAPRRILGGWIPSSDRDDDTVRFLISGGRVITDPDEAEALGLTADARRMRERGPVPDWQVRSYEALLGTSGGVPLTDELIEKLVDEAEQGYDLDLDDPYGGPGAC